MTPAAMNLSEIARGYYDWGFNPLPTNGRDKYPATHQSKLLWSEYQKRRLTPKEVEELFSIAGGIGLLCGKTPGGDLGLAVIDIDTKNDNPGGIWEELTTVLRDEVPGIWSKLSSCIVRTPSGGYHLHYLCSEMGRKQKFAGGCIEVLGQGSFCVFPPTPGYSVEGGGGVNIDEITPEEQATLISILRSIRAEDEGRPDPDLSGRPGIAPGQTQQGAEVWDLFNERFDGQEILLRNGWHRVKADPPKVYYRRPGDTSAESSGNWDTDRRLFYCFSTSTPLPDGRGLTAFALFNYLEHGDDWPAATRAARKLFPEAVNHTSGKTLPKATETPQERRTTPMEEEDLFWEMKDDGKLNVDRFKLGYWLKNKKGFGLYSYTGGKESMLVRVENGVVEESSMEAVRREATKAIIGNDRALELFVRGSNAYFGCNLFDHQERHELDFLKDTPDEAYYPFSNGVVVVSKSGVVLKDHGAFGKCIWKSQLRNFEISPTNILIEDKIRWDNGPESPDEFAKFLYNISGKDEARFHSVLTHIGYLLHRYKDPARPWAVIFAEDTDDEAKGGGTGKGLLVKAISHLLKVETIDGKSFRPDKSFLFQRLGHDTSIVAIEDPRKKFDFESLYSAITDGITIEKKHRPEIRLDYSSSPKFVITTNHMIYSDKAHSERRQRVVPFAVHYSPLFTPFDEFGHRLFDDWGPEKWNAFYNLLFAAVGLYLKRSVIPIPPTSSMHLKTIKSEFGDSFADWFADFIGDTRPGVSNDYRDLHKRFIESFGERENAWSQSRFTKALHRSCNICSVQFETIKSVHSRAIILKSVGSYGS